MAPREKEAGKGLAVLHKFTLLCAFLPLAFGQTALTTARIAKQISPSVVVIQGKTDSGELLGSGFIVSKDGKVVTNLHVIRDLKTVSVQTATGEIFDSIYVLATDERRDLAIVRVAGFNLPVLELGDSDTLTIGEPVIIVGSPRGLERTVTAGILSAVRDSGDGFKVLQTDTAMNSGNSGGPFVNGKGQAISVASFKLRSSEGLNFAIPVNYVRGLLANLHEPITLAQMREALRTSPASASDHGVSLTKTLDWLEQQIPRAGVEMVELNRGKRYSFSEHFSVRSFDSCTVKIDKTVSYMSENQPDGAVVLESQYTLPLASIDRSSMGRTQNGLGGAFVSGQEFGYRLFLNSDAKKDIAFTSFSSAESGVKHGLTDVVQVVFDNESIANEVLEAFNYAASLCRERNPF